MPFYPDISYCEKDNSIITITPAPLPIVVAIAAPSIPVPGTVRIH